MLNIGRFQVMATLQAARAVTLGFELGTAKSWGLNRAIFYAAAKKGYLQHRKLVSKLKARETKRTKRFAMIGGEKAYQAPGIGGKQLRFMIGGKTQTPQDFDKQIKRRFGKAWEQVWTEALQIIQSTNPSDLKGQNRFYKRVYQPARDELVEKWSHADESGKVVKLQPRRQKRVASKKAA